MRVRFHLLMKTNYHKAVSCRCRLGHFLHINVSFTGIIFLFPHSIDNYHRPAVGTDQLTAAYIISLVFDFFDGSKRIQTLKNET